VPRELPVFWYCSWARAPASYLQDSGIITKSQVIFAAGCDFSRGKLLRLFRKTAKAKCCNLFILPLTFFCFALYLK
jgi:hypothetical protein